MRKGVTAVIAAVLGTITGTFATGKILGDKINKKEKKIDKFRNYYNLLNQWLILKQEGKSLIKYFKDNNYKSIAIYGMGELGNRLYDELKNEKITVSFAIDKEPYNKYSEIKVIDIDDKFDNADVIVVTPVFDYDAIEVELAEKTDIKVISLEDIIYQCI